MTHTAVLFTTMLATLVVGGSFAGAEEFLHSRSAGIDTPTPTRDDSVPDTRRISPVAAESIVTGGAENSVELSSPPEQPRDQAEAVGLAILLVVFGALGYLAWRHSALLVFFLFAGRGRHGGGFGGGGGAGGLRAGGFGSGSGGRGF